MSIKLKLAYDSKTISDPSPKAFFTSGSVLLFLIGGPVPIISYLLGGDIFASIVSIGFAGVIYTAFVLSKRWIIAGLASSIPVLALFNINFPFVLPFIDGEVRVYLVDLPILVLGSFGLLYARYSDSKLVRLFIISTLLLAVWTLITGLLAVAQGFPTNGLLFGVNQFRYVFVAGSAFVLVYWFGIRLPLVLVLSTASYQTVIAISQAILGPTIIENRLIYLGEYGVSYGLYNEMDIMGVVIHSGKFAGGLLGSSRSLLAILVLLFPVAVYRAFCENSISGYICMVGAPLLIVMSAWSENGAAALFLMIMLLLVYSFFIKRERINVSPLTAFSITVVAGFCALIVAVWVLQSGVVHGTEIRWEQYVVATQLFLNNPLFGVGGMNFSIAIELLGITGSDRLFDLGDVHSMYLFYLYGSGLFGVALLLLPVGIAYWCTLRSGFSASRSETYIEMLMIGIFGISLYLSFSLVFLKANVSIVYWLGISMIVAEYSID